MNEQTWLTNNMSFNIKILFYLFGFFLFFSCNTSSNSECLFNVLKLQNEKNKVFLVSGQSLEKEYRDIGKDSVLGGYYIFYKNGNLKEYDFFINMDTIIYMEQYDSLGNLMYHEGNPLIHKSVTLINDSLWINLYLFSLNKLYKRINISTVENIDIPYRLNGNTEFSNVSELKSVIKIPPREQDIAIKLNIIYQITCTGEIKSISDNIELHYKPNKHYSP